MKKTLLFLAVVLMSLGVMAQSNAYVKITSLSDLHSGDKVILIGYNHDGETMVMSYQKNNNRHAFVVTENAGTVVTSIATVPGSETDAYEFTVGGSTGAWTFLDEVTGGYLYAPGGGNYLKTQSTLDNKGEWTITMDADGGCVPVSNGGVEQCIMRYNNTSTLFGCYKESSTINDLVYIFKLDGEPVIDPEPSNYPTNFVATVDLTNVVLNWNLSTGGQLPRGYLLLGSTGSINVPVDGITYEDDLEAGDGHVAINLNANEDMWGFHGFPANSTVHFAIFPYTNSGANIDYKTDGSYPTVNVTIDDIYCLVYNDFSETLEPMMPINVEGDQEWYIREQNSVTFAEMNGYVSGTYNKNEDWLITPNMLANGTFEKVQFSFKSCCAYTGDNLKVMLSYTYNGVNMPGEFDWIDITNEFSMPQEGDPNYTWIDSGVLTLDNLDNKEALYIAFVYHSTTESGKIWRVTEVNAYGTGYDAVGENIETSLSVYPNPASSSIRIDAESAAELQVLDMAGRLVMSVNVVEGANTISVADLQSGVYFVKMNGSVVKFVKK